MPGPIARLYATLGLDAREFKGGIEGAKATMQRMGGVAQVAGTAIGAGLGTAAIGALRMGEAYDAAIDAIRIGTGATGEALAGLEADFKAVAGRVPDDIGVIGQVLADLNTRTGQTGEGLQTLAEQMLDLSRITGTDAVGNVASLTRMFGDWSIAADDQAESLDQLFRASQATGQGVDALSQQVVQFGAPLRNLGFEFEDAIAMLAKWEKEGVNTTLSLGGLKIALGKFAKEGTDVKEGLEGLIEQIANATSETEAMSLGATYFGSRAGPDMVAAIREGRFATEDLVDVVKNGSDTISQATQDTEGLGEAWKTFKNVVATAVGPLFDDFAGIASEMGNLVFLLPAIGGALGKGLGALWQKAGMSSIVKGAIVAVGKAAGVIYSGAVFAAQAFAKAAAGLWASMGGGRVMAAARSAGMMAGGVFGTAFKLAAAAGIAAVAVLMAIELGKLREQNIELAAANDKATASVIASGMSKADAEKALAGLRAMRDGTSEELTDLKTMLIDFGGIGKGNVLGSVFDIAFGENPTANLDRQIAEFERYIAGIPEDLAAAVPTDGQSISSALSKLLGNAVSAVKAMGIEAPDIAGPLEDEFADARKAVLAGFGSIKDALKNPPQLISASDRLVNMEARMKKIMGNLRKAVAAEDPINIPYWQRAAAKQQARIDQMRAKTNADVDAIAGNVKKAGNAIDGTWKKTARSAGQASRTSRRTAISEFRALVGSVKGLNLQSAGTALINSWAAGIRAGRGAVVAAASWITSSFGSLFHGSAVPKKGPLKGFDRMGGDMLDAWVGVVKGRKAKVAQVGAEVAGAFAPRPQMPRLALAGGADGMGGGSVHIHIGTLIADDRGLDELERRMSRRHGIRNRGPMRYQQ